MEKHNHVGWTVFSKYRQLMKEFTVSYIVLEHWFFFCGPGGVKS